MVQLSDYYIDQQTGVIRSRIANNKPVKWFGATHRMLAEEFPDVYAAGPDNKVYNPETKRFVTRTRRNAVKVTKIDELNKVKAEQQTIKRRLTAVNSTMVSRTVGRTNNMMFTVSFPPTDDIDAIMAEYIRKYVPHGPGTNTPNDKFIITAIYPNGVTLSAPHTSLFRLPGRITSLKNRIAASADNYTNITDVDDIDHFNLSWFVNSSTSGRGSSSAYITAFGSDNTIVNIPTEMLCAFASVVITRMPHYTSKQVHNAVQYIKLKYMDNDPNYIPENGFDITNFNTLSKITGSEIIVMDSSFKLLYATVGYVNINKPTLYIHYTEGHYSPILSNDVIKSLPATSYVYNIIDVSKDRFEVIKLHESRIDISYNPNFMTYDIETHPFTDSNGKKYHKPYALAVAWHDHTAYNQYVDNEKHNRHDLELSQRQQLEEYYKAAAEYNNSDDPTLTEPIKPTFEPISKHISEYYTESSIWTLPIERELWYGYECIKNFADHIYNNPNIYNKKILYAHNGAKFDLNLLLEGIFLTDTRFKISNAVDLNNAIISLKLSYEHTVIVLDKKTGKFNDKIISYSVTFMDSCRQFPGSLDSFCRELNTPIKKLTGDVDHDAMNSETIIEQRANVSNYLYHDVASLLQCLDSYSLTVWNMYKVNITSCITSASLSKRIFLQNYNDPKNKPIFYMPLDVDRYIRASYYGGRVECFKHGEYNGNYYYYDFTSLYPAAATGNLPYGKPTYYNTIEINALAPSCFYSNNQLGFIRCMVRTTSKNFTPLHGIKVNGTLTFPYIDNWTEMTLFTEEIKMSLDLGLPYEYQYIDGYLFDCAPILNDFMTKCFKTKNDAKLAGHTALSQAAKIIANSAYGVWGLRVEDRQSLKIINSSDTATVDNLINSSTATIHDFITFGEYTLMRVSQNMDVKSYNVSIASAITSRSRCMLYKAMYDIKRFGGDVFYCDTDSIITNLCIEDTPALKSIYMPNNGDALGELKNEYADKYKKLYKKMGLGGDIPYHFNSLIVNGCKFYACRGTINNEHVDIVKCKGLRESDDVYSTDNGPRRRFDFITFKEFQDTVFYQNQRQSFNCSATTKLNDWHINMTSIVKSFRKCYNKGTFEIDGSVVPITI